MLQAATGQVPQKHRAPLSRHRAQVPPFPLQKGLIFHSFSQRACLITAYEVDRLQPVCVL